MKTLAKRLKRQEKCVRGLKREKNLLEHLVKQQYIMEQNAQKKANALQEELNITQKYMYYLAMLAIEKNGELLIELKDIEKINGREVDVKVYTGESGKIEKIKLNRK